MLQCDVSERPAGEPVVERRYVVAPHLMLEAHDDAHAIVVNTATGARAKVSIAAFRMLSRFDVPRTVSDVFGRSDDGRAAARVRALVDHGLLWDAEAKRPADKPRRRPAPFRFCNAPSYAASGARADVVVLGVPYDLGGSDNGREGPLAVRQKSLDYTYMVDFDARQPAGWFDAGAGARILEGVRIADADDIPWIHGEPQRAVFERVVVTLDELLPDHGVPLVLAGDASVSHAVAAWCAGRHPLSVVHFAAEGTAGEREGESVTVHDVARAMIRIPNVRSVATAGLREVSGYAPPPGVSEVTATQLRSGDHGDLVAALSLAERVLLSIDMDVVDVSTPPSGKGMSLREVREAIQAIGDRHRIVGVVVSGLDPSTPMGPVAAIVACHLALQALHVATLRRAG
ncbi:arginase family protein [Luteibacter sp. Lutesp34]|uniref:arginase family protein n=1 Tax=Luteibacter sp. Lutesp34 TaxID=3243030 RepID=UPI0039B6A177